MQAQGSIVRDSIAQLSSLVREGAPQIELEGFFGPGRAYFLARLLRETDVGPLLVIEPTREEAETLLADLCFFLPPTRPDADHPTPEGVIFYPAEEALPYEGVVYNAAATMERVAALFVLTQPDSGVRLVITSATALVRQTIARKLLSRHSELVVQGTSLDRDRLIATLQTGGYVQVPVCEDVGTYCVRGGIIDVFSPLHRLPVRIELFGDEVEVLREFDPETQRAGGLLHGDASALAICPIREVILDAETVERARDALGVLAEAGDFPTRKLKIIKEEIENRINFFGIEAYLPALYEDVDTLVDYVRGRGFVWLWDRRGRAEEEIANLRATARSEYEVAIAAHKLHFPPERHLESLSETANAARLHIETTAQSDSEAAVHLDLPELNELSARLTAARAAPNVHDHLSPLADSLRAGRAEGGLHVIAMGSLAQAERLRELLAEQRIDARIDKTPFSLTRLERQRDLNATAVIVVGELSCGFRAESRLTFLGESDVFGHKTHPRKRRRVESGEFISDLRELKEGDALVHVDHGVGRYRGLVRLSIRGVEEDYLHLEYQGGDKLYLPVYRIGLVQRYSSEGSPVRLDKLGGTAWETKKQRIKDAILGMAHDLLELYAKRQVVKAPAFPAPGSELCEFEAAFPFEETPDQNAAIASVLADLQKPHPMDRLICGDVGYGKTEVAVRAAYYAVLAHKQVAILVPTTVLAQQHFQTFKDRLRGLPVNVEVLSRFRDSREQSDVLARLKLGGVDIVIGTHRLLSQDVAFKDLGLIVIDEEQRFGVRHKERLRKLRTEAHVLTLSATPIPRTLQMSFLGIRDLSLITTPPVDRLAIRTQVTKFDEEVIRDAIRRELSRGGQVFFIHNRVRSIASMADFIARIVPEAKLGVGHGQMEPDKLERVMLDFVERATNVLVCTTIVESGLDIPSANTMIVNRADAFGLSQLYQLRGRIGRSKERAYAVLLVPKSEKITKDAQQRLEALQRFSELGSGFKIASHDLEFRGSGNLLGPDQSGHIAAVGFELYTELVSQAVNELKGGLRQHVSEPELRLPVTALIPEKYVPDTSLRLNYYKRMAQAPSDAAIFDVVEELGEFYGPPPEAVDRLAQLMAIKRRLQALGAKTLDAGMVPSGGARAAMTFEDDAPIDRQKLVELVQSSPEWARLTPDGKLVYSFTAKQVGVPDDLLTACKAVLDQLVTKVGAATDSS